MTRKEELLTLWIDGELGAAEQEEFERLMAEDASFAKRAKADATALGEALRSELKSEIEPPYPDFFNHHIQKRIREEVAVAASAHHGREKVSVWSWLSSPFTMGAAAAACALFALVLLTRGGGDPQAGDAMAVSTYAPDPSVTVARAEFDEEAGATVILLTGLAPIPDDVEVRGKNVATYMPAGPRGFGRFYTENAELAYIMQTDADGAPHIFTRSEG